MGRDTATALSLYVFVSPAAVRLGHGPYPRHSLAVLPSTDAAQNPASVCPAALEVPSFVVGIYFRGGHDLMERSPDYTAAQLSRKYLFFVGAVLLFTPIYLLQAVPNQLLDAEFQECVRYGTYRGIPPVLPVPDTSVSSVRRQYRYWTLGKFGTTSIPVPSTSVSSVRLRYRYRTLR